MAAQAAVRQRENGFRDKFGRSTARGRSETHLRRKAMTAVAAKVVRCTMPSLRVVPTSDRSSIGQAQAEEPLSQSALKARSARPPR